MTNKELQEKLNMLTKIANELVAESQRRYGKSGNLFFEAGGSFHLMDGDENEGTAKRQAHIRFTSDGYCQMGSGAW